MTKTSSSSLPARYCSAGQQRAAAGSRGHPGHALARLGPLPSPRGKPPPPTSCLPPRRPLLPEPSRGAGRGRAGLGSHRLRCRRPRPRPCSPSLAPPHGPPAARSPGPGSLCFMPSPHVGIHDQDTPTPHSYLHLNGVKESVGEDLPCQGIYGLERAIQPHPPQQTPLSGRGGGSQGKLSTVPGAKCQASARGLGLSPSPLAARCRPYPAWTHATALSVPQKTRP